jgi:hypothetical protein
MMVINVKVNQVELVGPAEDLFDHPHMMSDGVDAVRIQPQRFLANRNESRGCDRIAAGKQGYLVSEGHQLLRKPRDDSFRPSIKTWRNAFVKWRDLGNPHALGSFWNENATKMNENLPLSPDLGLKR